MARIIINPKQLFKGMPSANSNAPQMAEVRLYAEKTAGEKLSFGFDSSSLDLLILYRPTNSNLNLNAITPAPPCSKQARKRRGWVPKIVTDPPEFHPARASPCTSFPYPLPHPEPFLPVLLAVLSPAVSLSATAPGNFANVTSIAVQS